MYVNMCNVSVGNGPALKMHINSGGYQMKKMSGCIPVMAAL